MQANKFAQMWVDDIISEVSSDILKTAQDSVLRALIVLPRL